VNVGRQTLSVFFIRAEPYFTPNMGVGGGQAVPPNLSLIYQTARGHTPDNCTPGVQEFCNNAFNLLKPSGNFTYHQV
jgi:hypothetical protein